MCNTFCKDIQGRTNVCVPPHILHRITIAKQSLWIDQPMHNKFTKGGKKRHI